MTTNQKVVCSAVANYFSMEPKDMFKDTRRKKIVWPRQLFHYAALRWTTDSLSNIGGFGKRTFYSKNFDHATVLHSKKTITNLLFIKDKETWKDVHGIDYIISNTIHLESNLIPLDMDLLSKCEKYTESFI